MTVIAQVEMMSSKQFSSEFCDSFGNLIMVQLDNFMGDDMGQVIRAAQPSCECMAHNIHSLFSNGFQPAMIANIGTCANTVTNFVNMIMNMGEDMPKMDHDDWYTEEAMIEAAAVRANCHLQSVILIFSKSLNFSPCSIFKLTRIFSHF